MVDRLQKPLKSLSKSLIWLENIPKRWYCLKKTNLCSKRTKKCLYCPKKTQNTNLLQLPEECPPPPSCQNARIPGGKARILTGPGCGGKLFTLRDSADPSYIELVGARNQRTRMAVNLSCLRQGSALGPERKVR